MKSFSRKFSSVYVTLILTILVTLIIRNAHAVAWEDIRDHDKAALLAFRNAAQFDQWFNTGGWPGGTDGFGVHGITATRLDPEDEKLAVTSIRLTGNRLGGSLHSALGNLSELHTLQLNRNSISGSIPESLGKLSKLTTLSLESNDLTGEIPSSLAQLQNLEILGLDFNHLTGLIPPRLGELANLRELGLGDNELTGGHEIASQLVNLERLWLHDNALVGTLPDLSALSSLVLANLRFNNLTGGIPTSYGALPQLEILLLNNNNLTGEIPGSLGNLSNLEDLDLAFNNLTGTIPGSLGNLSKLKFLFLQENELSGALPPSFGNLKNLLRLFLNDNRLEGPIPAQLGEMVSVDRILLQNNFFFGALPVQLADPPNLFEVNLTGNNIEDVTAALSMDNANLAIFVAENNIPQAMVDQVSTGVREMKNLRAIGLFPQTLVEAPAEVSITLYRPHPLVGYTSDSIDAGMTNQDSPLVPVTDPKLLRAGTTIDRGLVADGVTPLVFRLGMTQLLEGQLGANDSRTFQFETNRLGGGFFNGFNVYHLNNGRWTIAGRQITLSAEQNEIWGYVAPIASDAVSFDEGENEIDVEFKVIDGNNRVTGIRPFAIRKPIVTLIHGYNTEGAWGDLYPHFLKKSRPEDFIVTVRYGVLSSAIAQDFPNTRKRLDALASDLDTQLTLALEPLANSWAFTRHDAVCHSQGGVLTRMLCVENSNQFVDEPYQNKFNAYRGRFHRVVTIGSPHNGARLLRYLLKLNENSLFLKTTPVLVARAMVLSSTAQDKFDPFGEQIRGLNDPNGMWIPDPDARFHLVRSTTNSGLPPTRASSTFADKALGLSTELGVDVLPKGSDAVVDFDSMIARGPGQPLPENSYTAPPLSLISHSGPKFLFDSTFGQTESGLIAQHVQRALDQRPLPNESVTFGPFVMPTRLTEDIRLKIDNAAAGAIILEEINIVIKLGATFLPSSEDGNAAYTGYEINLESIPGKQPIGDISWFAEAFTSSGVTGDGLLLKPQEDTRSIQLEVNDNVEGDVVLYALYHTGDNEVVISSPFLVRSKERPDLSPTDIAVHPDGIALTVDERVRPSIVELYGDGKRLERFLHADNIMVTSSDPSVIDVSDPLYWRGVADGTADITITYKNFTKTVALAVGQTAAASAFDAWLAQHFAPADLGSPEIVGFAADPDHDSIPNGFEFAGGRDPNHPEHGELLSVNNTNDLLVTITNQLGGVSAIIERSSDLQGWEVHYDISADPTQADPKVSSSTMNGDTTTLTIDTGLTPDQEGYFRIRIAP